MSQLRIRTGVVVIGRNEGERLSRCLDSLAPTGSPVIYVDSGSDDGSIENAAMRQAHVVLLDPALPFTAARARAEGFGALQASHPDLPYVFFVDGDCEVESGFLTTAEQFLSENPDCAAVCGRRRERFPHASAFNTIINEEWATPIGEANACGGDAIYRSAAYRSAGGFEPAMMAGEEPELCARLRAAGWRIVRLDEPMTIHDAALANFGQWWLRAVRSGMGYGQAWAATRHFGRSGLYRREISRAIFWAGLLPLSAVGLAMTIHPALISIWPFLSFLQWTRMASRLNGHHSLILMVTKYAELIGIGRWLFRTIVGGRSKSVTYK